MRNSFPVLVCIIGAIADFVVWAWLRSFKVRERRRGSVGRLSMEERQRKVTIASWIMFGSAWFFLAGAGVLWWLGIRR
jgi:hypothetical protein